MTITTNSTVAEREVLKNCLHYFTTHPKGQPLSRVVRREVSAQGRTTTIYDRNRKQGWSLPGQSPLSYDGIQSGFEGIADSWKIIGDIGLTGELIYTYENGAVVVHPFKIVEGPSDETFIRQRVHFDDLDEKEERLIDEIC